MVESVAARDADEDGWSGFRGQFTVPGERTRSAMEFTRRRLDSLESMLEAYVDSDREQGTLQAEHELEAFVSQLLGCLSGVRDAASEEIREVVEWAGDNTAMSTHALGRSAGLSATTVSRMKRAQAAS